MLPLAQGERPLSEQGSGKNFNHLGHFDELRDRQGKSSQEDGDGLEWTNTGKQPSSKFRHGSSGVACVGCLIS